MFPVGRCLRFPENSVSLALYSGAAAAPVANVNLKKRIR